jgi:two-component system invasion response regulator UvrY
MINILIADDHAVVRKGLRQILTETSDLRVVDEAVDGEDVLDKVKKKSYDVIVLDISMPGMSGLDVLKKLNTEYSNIPVLVLSIYSEDQYAMRVLKSGASGYLTKESAPGELVSAIRKVAKGGKYVSSYLAEKLAFGLTTPAKVDPIEHLSDREMQVLCMIASGKTISEIAKEIALSVKTVSTYRSRILTKMKLKNNAELTHYAIRNNLIE